MENQTVNTEKSQKKGVRLNRLNVCLIVIGFVLTLFMVFSMFDTNKSFNQIADSRHAEQYCQ